MESDSFELLIVFILCISLSGLLASVRSVFGFFKQYQERVDANGLHDIIVKSVEYFDRDSFSESILAGRFIFNCAAAISGTLFFLKPLSGLHPALSGQVTIITAFIISIFLIHLMSALFIPIICQAYVTQTARVLYFFFSIYWGLLGWAGSISFSLNRYFLKKLGYNKKYKIFTEEDMQKLDAKGTPHKDTGLEEDEAEMVQNIFNIGNTLVKEIFTPRVDTVALDINTPYDKVISLIKSKKFTRIPVYEDNIDTIKGILHVKDMLYLSQDDKVEAFSLNKLIRPAYFIPRSKKIDDLMTEFKKHHIHLAIVVDEYGGTAGLITLEDIIEEIVGEIQDEDDREFPKVSKVGESIYLIDPIIPLDDLNKELNIHLHPEEDVEIDTLGGYLQYLKGSVPQEGDKISSNGNLFEILKMDGQSIERVRLTKQDPPNHQSN